MSGESRGRTDSGDPPVPEIILSGPGAVTLNNGASATVQLTVKETRIGQAINLSAAGLPAGVSAVFTPASLPHPVPSQHVSLQLTASATALAAHATVQVKAAAGARSDALPVTLTVVSPFSVATGAPVLSVAASGPESVIVSSSPVKLAAFGHASVPINVQVAAGVSGPVGLAVGSALPGGVTAQFDSAAVTAPSAGGSFVVHLLVNAGGTVASGSTNVVLVARVAGVERAKVTLTLTIVAPFVSGVAPTTGIVPMFQRPGTQVKISGGGFGPGTTVSFGADSPVAAASVASDGSSLLVNVPRTAVTGPLCVISPAGSVAGPGFAVDSYRNTRGCSWVNSDAFQTMVGNTYSFADATALFGTAQTVFNVGPFNVLAPFVALFLAAVDQMLNGNGQCFGMALTSLRFITGQLDARLFPQQAAGAEPGGPSGPDVWTLNGPALGNGTNVSPALSSLIHQQHMAQFSQESINNWVAFHATVTSAAALRTAILQAFSAGGQSGVGALVAMSPSLGEGHVVVAFDIVDTGGGNFDIRVYNPNAPFMATEDTNLAVHTAQVPLSVIHVMSNGDWAFPEWAWTGNIWGLTVTPWNTIPLVPSFPMPEVMAAIATGGAIAGLVPLLLLFATGNAEITQVDDGKGHHLLKGDQLNVDPNTMLTGVRPISALGGLGKKSTPGFVTARKDVLTHTITGKAKGVYTVRSMGRGVATTLSDISIDSGATDAVSVDQGTVTFVPSVDKSVALTVLAVGKSNVPRTATLKTTAAAGAALQLSFDATGETFDYTHHGLSGNYSLELSTHGPHGEALQFSSAATAVAPGDTLTFKPDWSQLANGIPVNVRGTGGALKTQILR